MTVIKRYLCSIVATAFALLLAIIGIQRKIISKQQYDALRKERDEQSARADEALRQAQARIKAAEESRKRRAQAENSITQGRRNYFEQE